MCKPWYIVHAEQGRAFVNVVPLPLATNLCTAVRHLNQVFAGPLLLPAHGTVHSTVQPLQPSTDIVLRARKSTQRMQHKVSNSRTGGRLHAIACTVSWSRLSGGGVVVHGSDTIEMPTCE